MNESSVVTLSLTQCTVGCSDAKLTALRRDLDTHDVLRECLPLDSHFLHRLLSLPLLFGCCSDPKRVFSVCCAWVALAGGGIQAKRADAHVLILLSPEVASGLLAVHLIALLWRLQCLVHALGPLGVARVSQADLLVLGSCVGVLLNWLWQCQELTAIG